MVRLILDSPSGSYPAIIGSNIHRELRAAVARLDPTGVAIVTVNHTIVVTTTVTTRT